MEKLTYTTTIDAPRDTVWDVLWTLETYRDWTSAFSPGSTVETDWKEGSKILFLNGEGQGMVSEVATNRPPEYMSIRHLGMYDNGVEDFDSENVKKWAGAQENYLLEEVDGKTLLTVTLDASAEDKVFFDKVWPLAFERLRNLAEKRD